MGSDVRAPINAAVVCPVGGRSEETTHEESEMSKTHWVSSTFAAIMALIAVTAAAAAFDAGWEQAAKRECGKGANPTQAEWENCVPSVIQRALREGLISGQIVEDCKATMTRPSPYNNTFIWRCINRGGASAKTKGNRGPRPADLTLEAPDLLASSRIIKMYRPISDAASSRGPAIDGKGFLQPEFVTNVYAGRWDWAPSAGLDVLRYYAQTVGDLNRACPDLGLDTAIVTALPYALEAGKDALARVVHGEGSPTDNAQALIWLFDFMGRPINCRRDPSDRPGDYEACVERQKEPVTVMPSREAKSDVALLVRRYGCGGRETGHYASNLLAYAREMRERPYFADGLPGADTAEGRRYRKIFDNCARQTGEGAADKWCGCYVRQLYEATLDTETLGHLENNPFVDGRTYIIAVIKREPRFSQVYDCRGASYSMDGVRENRAPRITACLLGQQSAPNGQSQCTYRAAWGEFTVREARCDVSLTSRRWGAEEIACDASAAGDLDTPAADARPATPDGQAPRAREWQQSLGPGRYDRYIDYEDTVPSGFVPTIPQMDRETWSLNIRMLKQSAPGSLKSIFVSRSVDPSIRFAVRRLGPQAERTATEDLEQIRQEGQLYLTCSYVADWGLVRATYFWYKTAPRYLRTVSLVQRVSGHPLLKIKEARDSCPGSHGS
ncbi:MAG: hypothetical protein IPH26_09205 [Sterolibacteriaceae bacterium]|uniref:Uncharacterized protein n=1 Tax=Candidatus Methylophosphatis roskildensis TaxID=2899263 RepID=A0A9D7HLW6_9PROT|nr:hypothetical protein [Candidatus Methylophosphatis roskildensis]